MSDEQIGQAREIWWCEEHQSASEEDERICDFADGAGFGDCRMVEALLVRRANVRDRGNVGRGRVEEIWSDRIVEVIAEAASFRGKLPKRRQSAHAAQILSALRAEGYDVVPSIAKGQTNE